LNSNSAQRASLSLSFLQMPESYSLEIGHARDSVAAEVDRPTCDLMPLH
jgi:hypothetical protein